MASEPDEPEPEPEPEEGIRRRFSSVFMFESGAFLAVASTSFLALWSCPFTKVEESFGIQATHDLFYYGLSPALRVGWPALSLPGTAGTESSSLALSLPYDHVKYPGVVPRSFVGPLVLSTVCRLLTWMTGRDGDVDVDPLSLQLLARAVLLAFNLHALRRMARAASFRFGEQCGHGVGQGLVGPYLLLLTAVQFHLPFYSSRTLPNTLGALGLVHHCYASWLWGRPRLAAFLLVVATTVFRCDLLLLLFSVGLSWLGRGELALLEAVAVGLAAGATGLLLSVPLDSLLWRRWTWPEGEVVLFNTVDNRSSDWGTSPWHWYVTRALPRALLACAALLPLAVLRLHPPPPRPRPRTGGLGLGLGLGLDTAVFPYLLPAVLFVALYSCLPHKEIRFIFPALPLFNVSAAVGLARLHRAAFPPPLPRGKGKGKKEAYAAPRRRLILGMYLCALSTLAITAVGTFLFLAVSARNYPGGEALRFLQRYLREEHSSFLHNANNNSTTDLAVYIDIAAGMSGVTLFGQRAVQHAPLHAATVNFHKEGYEDENSLLLGDNRAHDDGRLAFLDERKFTFLVTEVCDTVGHPFHAYNVIFVAKGFPRIDMATRTIVTVDAICVWERAGARINVEGDDENQEET